MKKFEKLYNHIEEVLLVLMFFTMVVVIFIQVVMRYVFNSSLSWSDELGRFIFVWLSWMGVSIGQREGEHIKITMLTDKLPFKTAHFVNILADLIVIVICAVTAYYTVVLVDTISGAKYVSLHISYVWGYAAIPVGCTLMGLRTCKSMYNSIKEIKNGPTLNNVNNGGVE